MIANTHMGNRMQAVNTAIMQQIMHLVRSTMTTGRCWIAAIILGCAIVAIVFDVGGSRSLLLGLLSFLSMVFVVGICCELYLRHLWVMGTPRNLRMVPGLAATIGGAALVAVMAASVAGVALILVREWAFLVVIGFVVAIALRRSTQRHVAVGIVVASTVGVIIWHNLAGSSESAVAGVPLGISLLCTFFFMLVTACAWLGISHISTPLGIALWIVCLAAMNNSSPFSDISFTTLAKNPTASLPQVFTALASQVPIYALLAILNCATLIYQLAHFRPSRGVQDDKRSPTAVNLPKLSQLALRGRSFWQHLPGYDRTLERTLNKRGSFGQLLPLTFRRDVHWSTLAWMAAAHSAFIFGLVLYIDSPKPETLRGLGILMAGLGFTSFAALLPSAFIRATFQSRREHRLLTLAPIWPADMVVNKALAWHFAKYAGVVVGFGTLFVVIIAWLTRIEFTALWRLIAAMVLVGPLLLASLLRHYKVMPTMNLGPEMIGWVMLMMLPSSIMMLNLVRWQLPYWALAFTLVAAFAFAYWRYRRFLRLPAALPAGDHVT